MADLWSEREFCLIQAPVAQRKAAEEQLLNDHNTYSVDEWGYSWKQTQEDIEIAFIGHPLTPAEVKAARVVIKRTHLQVELKDEPVFDDELWEPVRAEESTWTVNDGVLVVELQKVPLHPPERNNWPRCGRSEPHKYDKEYKAREQRREARRREREEELMRQALAEVAGDPTGASSGEDLPDGDDEESRPDPSGTSKPEGQPATGVAQEAAATPIQRRRQSMATTGTAAECERLKREAALKEERKWRMGTRAEAWMQQRRQVGLGPMPAAEAWRRQGRCSEGL